MCETIISSSVVCVLQAKARQSHDLRLYRKVYDKSISDSTEAILGVFLLHMKPPCAARLLYLFGLSRQPHPLAASSSLADRLAVANQSLSEWSAHRSWVPLVMLPRDRGIDPEFAGDRAVDDNDAAVQRHTEVETMLQENLPTDSSHAPPQPSTMPSQEQLKSTSSVFGNLTEMLENKKLQLESLERIIGYRFRRIRILMQATTHASSQLAYHWGCYQR